MQRQDLKIKRGGRSIVACRKFQGFRPGNTIVHLNRIEIQAGTLNRIIFEWISCFFKGKIKSMNLTSENRNDE